MIYTIGDDGIELCVLSKNELSLLFRRCGLRGDTARIDKASLIERIAECQETDVKDEICQMIEDGEILNFNRRQSAFRRQLPITSTIKKVDVIGLTEVDIRVDGRVLHFKIEISTKGE